MNEYFGLRPTGRQFKDSGSTLVELEDDQGLRHVAIVLYDPFLENADLGLDFRGVLSFLEHPMVRGLVELKHHDLLTGIFVYPTGPMWTIREVLRIARDREKPLGLKTALELGILGTQILIEASATGGLTGCFAHGSLSPWRLALKPDGSLQVFGYGVPQVEVVAYLRDADRVPPAEAFRYVPPERVEQQPEDLAADTFSLMLIVAEAATGRRVHDEAQADAMVRTIRDGETVRRVHQLGLSRPHAALFAKALGPEPESRLSGPELLDALTRELAHADGPSLDEVMEDVLGHVRVSAGRATPLMPVTTGIVESLSKEDDEPIRWQAPTRGVPPAASEASDGRPPPPPTTASRGEATKASRDETITGSRRRRRSPRADPGDAAVHVPVERETAEPSEAIPRRVRTGTFIRPTPIGDRIPSPHPEPSPDEAAPLPRRRKPRQPRLEPPTVPTPAELPAPPRERRGARPPGHGDTTTSRRRRLRSSREDDG